jgi:hypothetical protein
MKSAVVRVGWETGGAMNRCLVTFGVVVSFFGASCLGSSSDVVSDVVRQAKRVRLHSSRAYIGGYREYILLTGDSTYPYMRLFPFRAFAPEPGPINVSITIGRDVRKHELVQPVGQRLEPGSKLEADVLRLLQDSINALPPDHIEASRLERLRKFIVDRNNIPRSIHERVVEEFVVGEMQ